MILQSLPESFVSFINNFRIAKQECTLAGLLNLLVTAQKNMPNNKGKEVVLVASSSTGKSKKKKGNKKKKPFVPGPYGRVVKNQSKKFGPVSRLWSRMPSNTLGGCG